MFARYLMHPLRKPLGQLAQLSEKLGCTADRMTLFTLFPGIALHSYRPPVWTALMERW